VHNNDYSEEEILFLNAELLEGALKEGDFVEVTVQINTVGSGQGAMAVRRVIIKLSKDSFRPQKNE